MGRNTEERWALVLELANEAAVVSDWLGDTGLSRIAAALALGAAGHIGVSDRLVLEMQRDLSSRIEKGPQGVRLAQDLVSSRFNQKVSRPRPALGKTRAAPVHELRKQSATSEASASAD